MLIEHVLPAASAVLSVGVAKTGKTLLAVSQGIAVASGHSWCDYYRVREPGAVLLIEQDDPRGAASVKDILQRSPVPVGDIPFWLAEKVPFCFGDGFVDWLETKILKHKLKLCILDSYTALRGSRTSGIDIVKAEQCDLAMLDELAKRTGCTILIIHHGSKGSAGLNWSEQAAGTFAMGMATGAQIHISRFSGLDANSPERLVRIRGRHIEDKEILLRFRKETLDYEHVMDGGAAALYPLIVKIRNAFSGEVLTPKTLCHATGISRATAHRDIDKLFRAGVLSKRGYGEYSLDAAMR